MTWYAPPDTRLDNAIFPASFELVIEPLLIWIVNVFVAALYVYVKSVPFDTAATKPDNDPLNVAAPIWVNVPKFLKLVPTVKSSVAETLLYVVIWLSFNNPI